MNITEINIYPIKSLRGTSVPEATVGNHGLENDRCWMLVDADGKKITQRDLPRLSLLIPHVEGDRLRVQIPGASDIVVSRNGSSFTDQLLTVDLWGHEHTGAIATDDVNHAFSAVLGMSCR